MCMMLWFHHKNITVAIMLILVADKRLNNTSTSGATVQVLRMIVASAAMSDTLLMMLRCVQ